MSIALIGGTGLATLEGFEIRRSHAVDTPYGQPSMTVEEGSVGSRDLWFLHRHGGSGRPIPPHLVNYRANIWALKELGITTIVAANAVGGISPMMRPGRLVIPDQLIDYTWGREHTFDDGSSGSLWHVDFTQPFDGDLRRHLLDAAAAGDVPHTNGAVLGVVQGPRLETAAEVRRLAADGCDLVGMTAMPEAALARELGLAYASICMVVNAAAGIDDAPITLDAIRENLRNETELLLTLLQHVLSGDQDVSARQTGSPAV